MDVVTIPTSHCFSQHHKPEAYITHYKLRLTFLLPSVVDRILQNADIFVSQENLTLGVWASKLSTRISFSEFVAGFDIDMSTLRNSTEVCIP